MLPLLAQSWLPELSPEVVISVVSLSMTSYFWLIQARRERPDIKFFQLRHFRATLRRGDPGQNNKRLAIIQMDSGGTLIANNSTRQNSIVRFDCFLRHKGNLIQGKWGYVDDDQPPWNIPPESTIAMSVACFFDVPEDCEIPENLDFRVDFVTVSGQRFSHMFSLNAPEL